MGTGGGGGGTLTSSRKVWAPSQAVGRSGHPHKQSEGLGHLTSSRKDWEEFYGCIK